MEVDEAYSLISRAIDAGRPAHGYLIVGDVRGNCLELVTRILEKLFPDGRGLLASRSHPDVAWLEPQGRSRTIKVARGKEDDGPGMRDGIVEPMSVTSFGGGWKAGVISGADRMQVEAANAFLKTLEEPPPKTIFLMMTDQPDAMLPTIVSRSQRIDLPMPSGILEGDDYEEVADAFAAKDAAALAAKLKELKDDAPPEDAAFVRKAFFKTLLSFARQAMLSGKVPRYKAFRGIEAVEDAYRQSERAMNDDAVLSFLLDRL